MICRRVETMHHAMGCFARVIRALLGSAAVAADKLSCGATLPVLGIDISLSRRGYCLRPNKEKALKCIAVMEQALAPGAARAPG